MKKILLLSALIFSGNAFAGYAYNCDGSTSNEGVYIEEDRLDIWFDRAEYFDNDSIYTFTKIDCDDFGTCRYLGMVNGQAALLENYAEGVEATMFFEKGELYFESCIPSERQ